MCREHCAVLCPEAKCAKVTLHVEAGGSKPTCLRWTPESDRASDRLLLNSASVQADRFGLGQIVTAVGISLANTHARLGVVGFGVLAEVWLWGEGQLNARRVVDAG